MKQTLGLRQSQKMTMTPQLQQAIRLLQMSNLELSEEIHLAHENNPLLEVADPQDGDQSTTAATDSLDTAAQRDKEAEGDVTGEDPESGQLEFEAGSGKGLEWEEFQAYMPIDQRRPGPTSTQFEDSTDYDVSAAATSLREHLVNQAIFELVNEEERRLSHHIIQNINDAGYLDVSLEEIAQGLEGDLRSYAHRLVGVLQAIQGFEPAGVAARSAGECLLLQLDALDSDEPCHTLAREIVDKHIDLLANRDFAALKKVTRSPGALLSDAVELIQNLNPHPGYRFGSSRIDYVTADILVEKKNGLWLARLNPRSLPRVSINQDYRELVSRGVGSEFSALKEQLQNARWLLSNLQKRHETILSVARSIVEKQQDFFIHGPSAMKPMTLGDVARNVGMHESTISRATSGKYLLAPSGLFELKYFFSSQVEGADGEGVSSLAIRSAIKEIINDEPRTKPVSDEKICGLLTKRGYKVARRTVAKYREQLNIPPSSKRKSI